MIDPKQLIVEVIRPTLARIDLGGAAAERLMLATAMQESGLTYLRQIGGGPALGLWQMEPATHDDCWKNFLAFRSALRDAICRLSMIPGPRDLIGNLPYACAMARVKYYRDPLPLPRADDRYGMAAYWKRIYNTPQGAGTIDQFVASWDRVSPAFS